jgi:phenylacetate-CoA ligase
VQRNHLFSSYHLSKVNLRAYYDALQRLRPPEIIGYPSSLFALATYVLEQGLEPLRPHVVFTTAETLLAHQRPALERAFGATVADQYGCTEMSLFVSQCEMGTYHLHPEHGILEVLLPDGKPAPEGTPGEAVCTGLVNMAMPLLRYQLGDRVVLSKRPCACGRSFPVIEEILGRMDDVLITPSGRPLGRLDPIFKPLSGIREAQILQVSRDRLLVRLATEPAFTTRDRESLLHELRKRIGDEMAIDLEFVPRIPKEHNGKFRAVVSLLPRGRSWG